MIKKLLFGVIIIVASCNSYNKKMNEFLSDKKNIEVRIDTNNAKDQRLRLLTGYDESIDSSTINPVYSHAELVDSIYYLKTEKLFLENELKNLSYSIDSLQKLK